jgi:serine phosphatase RsbU (regulator of sigma subunit)
VIKGSKTAVGRITDIKYSYQVENIKIETFDLFCMASDGFQDQFGGVDDKKFKKKNLYQLIEQNSSLPEKDLEELLSSQFYKWKGNKEQVDDVSILGIRI